MNSPADSPRFPTPESAPPTVTPFVLRHLTLSTTTATDPVPSRPPHRRSPGRTREAARWLAGDLPAPHPPSLWPLQTSVDDPAALADTFYLRLDPEGGTVSYVEPGRSATILWGSEDGLGIYFDTLERWQYADGTTASMTDDEQVDVARRILGRLRDCLGREVRLK